MRPGLRFLHVGSGTGYFASIVGVMLQGNGSNHGVELRDELVTFARGATARYAEKLGVAMPTQFIRGNALALDVGDVTLSELQNQQAPPPLVNRKSVP